MYVWHIQSTAKLQICKGHSRAESKDAAKRCHIMRHFALTRAAAAASKEIKARMKLNATLCHAHPIPVILIPIPSQKNATRQRDGQKTVQSPSWLDVALPCCYASQISLS